MARVWRCRRREHAGRRCGDRKQWRRRGWRQPAGQLRALRRCGVCVLAECRCVGSASLREGVQQRCNDRFGQTLALSADGSVLAVGASGEDSAAAGLGGNSLDNSSSNSGAAYVFVRNAGLWSQQAYLKASNSEAEDWFGGAVALSADGNTLAVSARQEGSAATGVGGNQTDNSAKTSGAVYVFTRSMRSGARGPTSKHRTPTSTTTLGNRSPCRPMATRLRWAPLRKTATPQAWAATKATIRWP